MTWDNKSPNDSAPGGGTGGADRQVASSAAGKTATGTVPAADSADNGQAVTRFAALFGTNNRSHIWTYQRKNRAGKDGKVSTTSKTHHEPPTEADYRKHLARGGETLGLGVCPNIGADYAHCLWGAIDIDDYAEEPANMARQATEIGLPVVVCRSKSGGPHVYVFFREPEPAAGVRELLERWAGALGHPGTEIFPKHDKLVGAEDWGNSINLPYRHGDYGTRHGYTDTGDYLPLTEFLDAAESRRTTLTECQAITLPAPPPTDDEVKRAAQGTLEWTVENGKVVDGRDAFLLKCTYDAFWHLMDGEQPPAADDVAERAWERFSQEADTETPSDRGGQWTERDARRKASNTVKRYNQGKLREPQRRQGVQVNNRPTVDIAADAWGALEAQNGEEPTLFRFGNRIARLSHDGEGRACLEALGVEPLLYELENAARWVHVSGEKGEKAYYKAAPRQMARHLMATPPDHNPLPPCQRLVRAPVMGPTGTVLHKPGYSAESQLYLAPDVDPGDVPDQPTADDAAQAAGWLMTELLTDFPFEEEADRAHALALVLLPFAREMIAGPTPLHVIDKPEHGTGASLLTDVCALPFTGAEAPKESAPERGGDDEWRKKLTTALMQAPAFLVIDNVADTLDSPSLASVLTATTWSDRKLGGNERAELPVRCAFAATLNNAEPSKEIARRTVRVHMDAEMERPWEREPKQFRHPNLKAWARENRASLVRAALTILRAWVVADRPAPEATLGSYDDWSHVIGGALRHAGVTGFLANRHKLYEQVNDETAGFRQLLMVWARRVWYEALSDRLPSADQAVEAEQTANALGELARESEVELYVGRDEQVARRMGRLLGKMEKRRFNVDVPSGTRSVPAGTYQFWIESRVLRGVRQYRLRHRRLDQLPLE